MGLHILGTGSYMPEKILTNDDYKEFIETNDEWIRTRTGISSRHIATGEPTWYMGAEAAKEAMIRENVKRNQRKDGENHDD